MDSVGSFAETLMLRLALIVGQLRRWLRVTVPRAPVTDLDPQHPGRVPLPIFDERRAGGAFAFPDVARVAEASTDQACSMVVICDEIEWITADRAATTVLPVVQCLTGLSLCGVLVPLGNRP